MSEWAGLSLDRPRIMGIVNATPDSFSDGGRYGSALVAHAFSLRDEGAEILDVGGESTRPGARAVPTAEEIARIRAVVRELARAGCCVSIDTRNAETMRVALGEGAAIVNDVSALAHDPEAPAVVATAGCPVVLMHMRGTPETMDAHTSYGAVAAEVAAELSGRMRAAANAGILPDNVALDPGIGFAKTATQNAALLAGLPTIAALGRPLVVGVSRKRVVGHFGRETRPGDRLPGSLAAALFALSRGAAILRVHDVAATVQAVRVWTALASSAIAADQPQ